MESLFAKIWWSEQPRQGYPYLFYLRTSNSIGKKLKKQNIGHNVVIKTTSMR